MSLEFAGAYGGRVTLSFLHREEHEPGYVLVFPFYQGQLLMGKHERRGWEVPGGTREAGEWPICTAIRETYEETGAELEAIEWIAQYVVREEGKKEMVKSVYIARVKRLHPLPPGFETEEIRLFPEWPDPEAIRQDPAFSLIMKDDVYRYILEYIREQKHAFAQRK